jgi:hypothetical protein
MKRKDKEIKFDVTEDTKFTSKDKNLFRKTKIWTEFRKLFLIKHPKCELCGASAQTVHHHHLSDNAKDYMNLDEERFHALCQSCHRFIHARYRVINRKKNPPEPDKRLLSILNDLISSDS